MTSDRLTSELNVSAAHGGFTRPADANARSGLLQPMAATRMQELGQWIQRCYNSTYAAQVGDTTHNPVKLQVAGQFDRWVLREDQVRLFHSYYVLPKR